MPDVTPMRNSNKPTHKYRASCDSCHEAKVRCSQTRPGCARCLKHGICCVYGISQRSGKHSAETYNAMKRNSTVVSGPPTPPATTGTEILNSFDDTEDPTDFFLSSPIFPDHTSDPPDILGQKRRQWTFDSNIVLDECIVPQWARTNYNSHSMLGKDEIQKSSFQQHPSRPSSRQCSEDALQSARHESIYSPPPVSTSCGPNEKASSLFQAGLMPYGQNNKDENLSSSQASTPCTSCAANSHAHFSLPSGTCRCNEVIIAQLSLLPVLLQNERRAFDVELVQFQQAIRLCASVLACSCSGKDYTTVLTISMLIARIVAVFERGGGNAYKDDVMSSDIAGRGSINRSPKFSLGTYQIDGEDERRLKQEVWWLQLRKVESLVAGFKEMFRRAEQQQVHQDMLQAAAWEKLYLLLDQKAQAVKRDWVAARGNI
ncbi:MAG: hypothetical protein Q9187_000165 [Circinaria calcarea]